MKLDGKDFRLSQLDYRIIGNYLETLDEDEFLTCAFIFNKFGIADGGYNRRRIKNLLQENCITYHGKTLFSSKKNIKKLKGMIENLSRK